MFNYFPNKFTLDMDPTFDIDWDPGVDRVHEGRTIKGRPTKGYGTRPFGYTGKEMTPAPWEECEKVNVIRRSIERIIGEPLHFCLAAMSGDHNVSVFPHKDTVIGRKDESYFICSVSFGSPRIFRQKWDADGNEDFWILNSGDLVIMSNGSQELGYHDVPTMKSPAGPRLNLTYRTVKP